MTRPALYLSLPCSVCNAHPGDPCTRRDGGPRVQSHHRRTPVSPCGTPGGYQRHTKAGEEPCAECLAANADYMASWRRHTDAPSDQVNKEKGKARWRAINRLISTHPDEFEALLSEELAS